VGIDFAEWPQQSLRELKPAMVTDLAWRGFGEMIAPVMAALLPLFPGAHADQHMLSVVMPGHAIEPHVDHQGPQWICRVHVPLTSNPLSRFIVAGEAHQLIPGNAYRVNTEAIHAVENGGRSARVHFMFDVKNGHG